MERIRIKDKTFELFIPDEQIQEAIADMARRIDADMRGKNPLFVGILNGAFMFVGELMHQLDADYELTFACYSSYRGTSTTRTITEVLPIRADFRGRPVILLEDIIDTGYTMSFLTKKLYHEGASEVRLATMLFKPSALRCELTPDYVGIEIPTDFIVGHGLDYDGWGRAYRDIYKIIENK